MMLDIIVKLYYFVTIVIKSIIWEFSNKFSDSQKCLVGKTAIVTGGSAGIGYATSMLLASRGCKVIIACRRDAVVEREKIIETTGNPLITVKKLDLMSLKSIRIFAEDIRKSEDKIDILINNAGIGGWRNKITADGLNPVMQVNYFGPFLLTHLLLGPLKNAENARVVFVTSVLAALNKLNVGTINMTEYEDSLRMWLQLYCNSKFGVILATQEFAKKMKIFGVTVNVADTGPSKSEMYQKVCDQHTYVLFQLSHLFTTLFSRTTFIAAQTSFHLASSEKLKNETGQLYFRCKPFHHYQILDDQEYCDSIWKKSEELVNLREEEKM